MVPTLNEIK